MKYDWCVITFTPVERGSAPKPSQSGSSVRFCNCRQTDHIKNQSVRIRSEMLITNIFTLGKLKGGAVLIRNPLFLMINGFLCPCYFFFFLRSLRAAENTVYERQHFRRHRRPNGDKAGTFWSDKLTLSNLCILIISTQQPIIQTVMFWIKRLRAIVEI